jgi:hypothetical protein
VGFGKFEDVVPVSEWFKIIGPLLQEGYRVRIQPKGRSMVPFLVGNRDEAVLSAPDINYRFQKNDIVFYQMTEGVYVLHRVCRINENGIYILGDAHATGEEGPFKRSDILAVADYIIRKGKRIDRRNRGYLFLVSLWRFLRPLRPLIIWAYFKAKGIVAKPGI